jgi:hypothetical protein
VLSMASGVGQSFSQGKLHSYKAAIRKLNIHQVRT